MDLSWEHLLVIVLGMAIAVFGVDWLVLVLLRWLLQWESEELSAPLQKSLRGVGRYIGWTERFFILLMMLVGYYEGIGFVLAAKSILRMGDLRGEQGMRFSEYVILGTLLSFSFAFLFGILLRAALGIPVRVR